MIPSASCERGVIVTIKKRVEAIEKKVADLEAQTQSQPIENGRIDMVAAEVSVLAHEMASIAADCYAIRESISVQVLREAKQHLMAAKEILLKNL